MLKMQPPQATSNATAILPITFAWPRKPPYLSPLLKFPKSPIVDFCGINMRSLNVKFQLYSFKTEGGI